MAQHAKTGARVRRRDSRTWVEGVPESGVGEGWDRLVRGIRILLEHRGEEVQLRRLMALSGDAFNLCFAAGWHGMARLAVPTDTLGNVAAAFGYDQWWHAPLRAREMSRLPLSARRELTHSALKQIREEIDAGRPVLAGGCTERGCDAWSVVVGYDDSGEQLCHVGIGEPYCWASVRGLQAGDEQEAPGYWDGCVRGTVRPNFVGGRLANPVFLLGESHGLAGGRATAVGALSRAVDLFEADRHEARQWGDLTCWFGRRAYQEWAGALDDFHPAADSAQAADGGCCVPDTRLVMAGMLDNVVRGRTAAAEFCNRAADVLGNVRHHTDAAARSYRREVALARDAFPAFIAGGPREMEEWLADPERRSLGAEAVRNMLEHEQAAVRAIQQALQVERQEVPPASTHSVASREEAARSREKLEEEKEGL